MIWIFLFIFLIWAFISVFGGKAITKLIVALSILSVVIIIVVSGQILLEPEFDVKWSATSQRWERGDCIKNCRSVSKDVDIDKFNELQRQQALEEKQIQEQRDCRGFYNLEKKRCITNEEIHQKYIEHLVDKGCKTYTEWLDKNYAKDTPDWNGVKLYSRTYTIPVDSETNKVILKRKYGEYLKSHDAKDEEEFKVFYLLYGG